MSEVKRYDFVGGDGPGAYPVEDIEGRMVSYEDFDAERLRADTGVAEVAALREELATANGCLEEWRRSKLGTTLLENANLQQRLAAAEQRNVPLIAFANELTSAALEGGGFDGGDIQEIAVKHGLMRIENRNEECGEACACGEYGFPAECYRKTELIKPTELGAS